MQDHDIVLDELDLALINCLEIAPRATWQRIGAALEVDPVTVARRWRRLGQARAAWVGGRATGVPDACQAIVLVNCANGTVNDTAQRLARWPHVLSVEHISGGHDLSLLIAVPSLGALSRLLLESLSAVPGVAATSTMLVTRVYRMGDQWQLNALDAAQRARLMDGVRPWPARSPAPRPLDAADRTLVLRLGHDGRTPLAELAHETGLSISTVRRRLDGMITAGQLVLRCDLALSLSNWPVGMWLWARADPNDRTTVEALLRIPGARVCMRVSGGEPNLAVGFSLPSVHEVLVVESRLSAEAPRLTIVGTSLVLRFIKRMGHVLDSAGHSATMVPMTLWADPGEPTV
ncbi:DNA-binding Lrp family transcriptional regulator [Nocardia transvalensis]|uniref:DNA-binding Lrp family transcriptional regulator n=1 Tax=Nocardia transvalensis TaxID=37333 RepID=A0A7W9P837_9NOCA|nr:Lrp/AsnC family transcriptional regulator [Nocardia transvalensis]MBB5911227.1 DNA-binding Lrp family transcriptional regulator [Nocardia transvalensis]